MDAPDSFFISLVLPNNHSCNILKANIIFATGSLGYLLFLPIFLFIFCVGFNKWKRTCSGAAASSISHGDTLTYHMVAMETTGIAGSWVYCYGVFAKVDMMMTLGTCALNMLAVGQLFFHCLTCVERYLAVVHPITYLRLKERGGVAIRNVSVAVAWLCSVAYGVLTHFPLLNSLNLILGCGFAVSAVAVVSFCSVSVLCVLIRPGPGERGGDKKRMNQSKRTALYTMMAIVGVLLVKLVVVLLFYNVSLSESWIIDKCVLLMSMCWLELPSCLVLPLLFLHREGKPPGCQTKKRSR